MPEPPPGFPAPLAQPVTAGSHPGREPEPEIVRRLRRARPRHPRARELRSRQAGPSELRSRDPGARDPGAPLLEVPPPPGPASPEPGARDPRPRDPRSRQARPWQPAPPSKARTPARLLLFRLAAGPAGSLPASGIADHHESGGPGRSAPLLTLTLRRLYPARPLRAPLSRNGPRLAARPGPALARDVVDDERNALEVIGIAQPVLEVKGPVAIDQPAIVHLDREARRPAADLRRVVEPQPPAVALRGRAVRDHTGDEPVQLGSRDSVRRARGERDRLPEHRAHASPGERRA